MREFDGSPLRIPPVKKPKHKYGSFTYNASVVQHRLPLSVRESVSIDTFKTRLKKFYFNKGLVYVCVSLSSVLTSVFRMWCLVMRLHTYICLYFNTWSFHVILCERSLMLQLLLVLSL